MDKREELIAKLGELRHEFEGFPEEQKVFDDAVSELSTKDSKLLDCSSGKVMEVTDLLRMAKQLGAYCHSTTCDNCAFDPIACVYSSWRYEITDELISTHDGETAVLNFDNW